MLVSVHEAGAKELRAERLGLLDEAGRYLLYAKRMVPEVSAESK
jgi:hypothetical protein